MPVPRITGCPTHVHEWGRRNRVTFDATKAHIIIIHPTLGDGNAFHFLECHIDAALRMHDAVHQIVARARPKIRAILRLRAHYSVADMLMQYKTHIWGFTEYANGCITHAAPSLLDAVDRMQRSFLYELNMDEEIVFLEFNFGPPGFRRDIGMLGLIHKRVLGVGPSCI